jgi:hypothetical protein
VNYDPIPDDDLTPDDFNLRVSRYMARNVPKQPGEHRWKVTTYTINGEVVASIRWCHDCGLSDHHAPDRCTHLGKGDDGWAEMVAAHRRVRGYRQHRSVER